MNRPTILLTGATSQIGVFLLPRLVRAGFHVLAVSRRGKPEYCPVTDQVEWLRNVDQSQAYENLENLISAGPLELARTALKVSRNLRTAVIFSSSSVITKRNSVDLAERSQIQDMLRIESELISIAADRGIKLVIFRPTMIYGCGLDTNITRLADWIRRFGFLPVNGEARGLRQPVHADDLAAVSVAALLHKGTLPESMVLAGDSTLSYAELVARIFPALGKPVRLLRLPQWLFVSMVRFLKLIRPASTINSEMVRRQSADLVFDDQQARELLAYKPRPFEPSEKDFKRPEPD